MFSGGKFIQAKLWRATISPTYTGARIGGKVFRKGNTDRSCSFRRSMLLRETASGSSVDVLEERVHIYSGESTSARDVEPSLELFIFNSCLYSHLPTRIKTFMRG